MNSEDFIARVVEQYKNKLPFVVYRKPNDSEVKGIFQNTDQLYFTENFTEKGFVFSPFDNTKPTVLLPYNKSETIKCQDWNYAYNEADKNTSVKNTLYDDENGDSKDIHIDLVNKCLDALDSNSFQKLVITRRECIELKEFDIITTFKRLISKYQSAFVYGWYHPKVGLWLGATPETLLKIEGKRFSMMALAGTQVYNGSLDVTWEEKEKEEQQLVTDFIIDSLDALTETKQALATTTVKAGNLVHLKTMVTALLKEHVSLKEVIDILHPTPAVCGLPKGKSKQFILNNEDYNREFYTGFLGELNLESMVAPRSGKRNIENRAYTINRCSTQLYVNLRCMQIKKSQAYIYVGGGITNKSNPVHEWQETVSKSLVMKSIL
ncbi:chorismate-binding protein [Cognatitamlana onchidii]|uniref:chorismate-binding protein n=1 Tax=Cognatitamlana onchidii TaxID=2562860 RepID=UPI0010A6142C|nr:chorismate-binding protein [Algibacter onchidii]